MSNISRRDFLKHAAAAGALVATSQLPSFAEDKPSVFPDRGIYERLSLCYAVVNIGNHEYSPDLGYSNPREEKTEAFKAAKFCSYNLD